MSETTEPATSLSKTTLADIPPVILTKGWNDILSVLPQDLEASARTYAALQRRRKIASAADLLRLILIYATLPILRHAVVWGVALKLGDVSRQNLGQRVQQSTPWLRYLVTALLPSVVPPVAAGTSAATIRRVVLRDASVISRPGSPGTEWRLHLSWTPFAHQPTQVTLTDEHTGEDLDDAGLQAGDLVLADRAYGIWRTVKVALEALAFFIIRLTWSNLPLVTPAGQPFDLIEWLKTLPLDSACAEVSVVLRDDPQRRTLRLVAGRLPPDKTEEARQAVREQARKEKREVNPNTLLTAGFCLVLTNLAAATWSSLMVLAFYRVRWQIEWCFRRWKSLCRLDELPAYPSPLAEPVLLAKLIIILLAQRHLGALPWQNWLAGDAPAPAVSPLLLMVYNHLCEIICPAALILQILAAPTPFLRHLRSAKRKRPLQLADAVRRFAPALPGLLPAPS